MTHLVFSLPMPAEKCQKNRWKHERSSKLQPYFWILTSVFLNLHYGVLGLPECSKVLDYISIRLHNTDLVYSDICLSLLCVILYSVCYITAALRIVPAAGKSQVDIVQSDQVLVSIVAISTWAFIADASHKKGVIVHMVKFLYGKMFYRKSLQCAGGKVFRRKEKNLWDGGVCTSQCLGNMTNTKRICCDKTVIT